MNGKGMKVKEREGARSRGRGVRWGARGNLYNTPFAGHGRAASVPGMQIGDIHLVLLPIHAPGLKTTGIPTAQALPAILCAYCACGIVITSLDYYQYVISDPGLPDISQVKRDEPASGRIRVRSRSWREAAATGERTTGKATTLRPDDPLSTDDREDVSTPLPHLVEQSRAGGQNYRSDCRQYFMHEHPSGEKQRIDDLSMPGQRAIPSHYCKYQARQGLLLVSFHVQVAVSSKPGVSSISTKYR
ncbi:hypothetical protein BDZ91DRAFT_793690 [Kalaharituber pfeilii]|nr:hypothetical protein BDZ91DRAFT_793690 [Kalaharituber pfeilii]